MKIQKIMMKHFGKFKNRSVEFQEGINIVYGENESGKSTVHAFIKGMLFGMERGRGRAAAKDMFCRYEPWDRDEIYDGSMTFECGGKRFLLHRDFNRQHKKCELHCLEDGESLSVEDGDLEILLGGLSESVYDNTVSVGQLLVHPDKLLAQELKNYATNYYLAGDGELNIAQAFSYLAEKRKKINKKIQEEFQEKQIKKEKIEQEASFVWREIHRLSEEQELLETEIAYQKQRCLQQNVLEKRRITDELRPEKWRIHPLEIATCVAILFLIVFVASRPWNYLMAIVWALLSLIYTWNRMKVGKTHKSGKRVPTEAEDALQKLLWKKERGLEERKEKEVRYNNLREQMEELHDVGVEAYKLEKQRDAIDLAEKRLEAVSKEMQKQIRRQINQRLSEIIAELTGWKYETLTVEDDLTIFLVDEWQRIPLDRVSRGTIEQVYLALRLVVSEILQEEQMPLILDDTFAYYDDARLKRTLQWLQKNKKQVIIFTCQKREENILNKMGIDFHKIEL